MKHIILVLAVLGLTSAASATIVFSPGVSYSSQQTDLGSASAKGSELLLDLKLGYVFPMGFYVGGIYHMASNSGGTDSPKASHFGPSIGYYSPMGFYGMLSYYLMGEASDEINTGDTLSEVTGPQLDLGWVFPLTANFSMGPQLTYRAVSYAKQELAGISTDIDYTTTDVRPYISLWFMF